ncbi:dihydroorotate dehydrogenase [Neomoorella humiferrea]|uniref:dihydroorotate dehydrogenase n=1 Tax=Neomoorella humiferrea TaxID=676965 RepID=UPI003BAE2718
MKNPVMTSSGTYGFGLEIADFYDPGLLGAIVIKSLAPKPWSGNKPPRIAETPAGILNAVGLQNPGVEAFIQDILPRLKKYDIPVIANIVGHKVDEYVYVARRLSEVNGIAGLELNASCPNVEHGGLSFGTDPGILHRLVASVRKVTNHPLIVKLTPNVTDITVVARAAEEAGADALSLINTLKGMSIDIYTRRPKLGNITGGLSGPAVRPVAVCMVWQVARAVSIPVIGMGGIITAEDAVEFILAGARAVSLGTANFVNPQAPLEVIRGLRQYLIENKIADINELVGKVIVDE